MAAGRKTITIEINGQAATGTLAGLYDRAKQLRTALQNLDPNVDPKKVKMLSDEYEKVQKQIEDVQAATGLARKETDKFSETLANLGKATFWVAILQSIYEWAKAFVSATDEVVKLRGEIARLTDAEGTDLDKLTTKVMALSKTFDKDYKEVLLAVNNFTKQMGITHEEAFALVEKGFIAGADAGDEFLDKIKEYGSQFKETGLDAKFFVKAATQEVKGGVYSDKFMDTVKEIGLRMREMTKSQQDALENAFGTQWTSELVKDIDSGSITAIQAYERMMKHAEKTGLSVTQLQTITADVMAGAGEDVGGAAEFWKIYQKTVASSLEPTTAAQKAQEALLNSNKLLAEAQNELAKTIEGENVALQILTNQGLAIAAKYITLVIEKAIEMGESLYELGQEAVQLLKELGVFNTEADTMQQIFVAMGKAIDYTLVPLRALIAAFRWVISLVSDANKAFKTFTAESPRISAVLETVGKWFAFLGEKIGGALTQIKDLLRTLNLLPAEKKVKVDVTTAAAGDSSSAIKRKTADGALLESQKKAAEEAAKRAAELLKQREADEKKFFEIQTELRIKAIADERQREQELLTEAARKQALAVAALKVSEEQKATLISQIEEQLERDLAAMRQKFYDEDLKARIEAEQEAAAMAKEARERNTRDTLGRAQGDVLAAEMGGNPRAVLDAKLKLMAEERVILLANTELTEGERYRILQDYAAKEIALRRDTARAERELLQSRIAYAVETSAVFAELFEEQTTAGRAFMTAFKTLQTAQIIASGIAEIQGIWENANKSPINALVPGWGTAYAVGQSIAAAARTAAAVGKVNAVKYAGGGVLPGASHAMGGVPVRIGGGQIVEAEGGEFITNKAAAANNAPALDLINRYGATRAFDVVPRAAAAAPGTTPSLTSGEMSTGSPMSAIRDEMRSFAEAVLAAVQTSDAKPVVLSMLAFEDENKKMITVRQD